MQLPALRVGATPQTQHDGREVIMMGAWVIGNNMPGCLPNPDSTWALADWNEACAALCDEMRTYADGDDGMAWTALPGLDDAASWGYTVQDGTVDYGDDMPAMRGTVDAILADDGPDCTPRRDWSATVEENSGHHVTFWIMWSDDRDPDPTD
jgi:hypothetical protein